MKLNDTICRNLKSEDKKYRKSDGDGLYLEVMPNGKKYWRMNYRFLGKQNTLAFGVYPRVTLKEAREKREDARKLLDNGQDPSLIKKQQKLDKTIEYTNTLETIAREYWDSRKHVLKGKYASVVERRFERDIFPDLGSRPVSSIKPQELLIVIRKVEKRGAHDLAHRMMQYCSQIFRYAVATGKAEYDITRDLKDALVPVKGKGHPYLNEKALPVFLKKLNLYDTEYNGSTLTKLSFKLLVLSFVRSGEIRGAKWEEVNWDKAYWRIPPDRMKMKEEHIVPLAKQSLKLLREIEKITGDNRYGYIFPSQQNPHKTMSENTFNRALRIMGYSKEEVTGHGFRSTASTVLHEHGFNSDWVEAQLAHGKRGQVRAAYDHSKYIKDRHDMMQWWADYLEGIGMNING